MHYIGLEFRHVAALIEVNAASGAHANAVHKLSKDYVSVPNAAEQQEFIVFVDTGPLTMLLKKLDNARDITFTNLVEIN